MKYLKTFTEAVLTQGRNIDYNKAIFDNAAKFFIKQLFGTDNVNITISFSQIRKGAIGGVEIFDTIANIKNKKFNLVLDKNTGSDVLLGALAHELTHIKQVYKGELGVSNDNKYLMWKGANHITIDEYNRIVASKNIDKYVKLPWEQEAYANQEILPAKMSGVN